MWKVIPFLVLFWNADLGVHRKEYAECVPGECVGQSTV